MNVDELKEQVFNEWSQSNNTIVYDEVNQPKHYTNKNIEVIDYIIDTVADPKSFCIGNVIKYISRFDHKDNALTDLLKAEYYLKKAIELLKGEVEEDVN
jgi:hypothetical protein